MGLCASPSAGEPAPLGMMKKMKHTSAVLIAASLCCWCNSEPLAEEHSEIIHPKAFAMVTCWLSDTEQPVVTEISLDAVRINRNQFYGLVTSSEDGWVRYSDEESGGFLRYRTLEPTGGLHRVLFQDNGGGSLTVSTTIGYTIQNRNITTGQGEKSISVLKVESLEYPSNPTADRSAGRVF